MKTKSMIFAALGAMAFVSEPFADDNTPNDNAAKVAVEQPANEGSRTNAPAIGDNDKALRLNFRGVSLDQVLNYMSEAAGFIINIAPNTEVRGKVDVWSNQPLTKDEAVDLLKTVLNQNNLTAIRTGRTLTIVNRDRANQRYDVPVKVTNKPAEIPKNDEMVTQIIPVHYANASALVQNLQPLLPEYAQNNLSANESGNSLILTASQNDIHRIVEVVAALDTAISSVSEIKVYQLKYADAAKLVDAVKELFTPPTAQQGNQNNGRAQFLQRMFGGGGGPGGFGGGGNPFGGGGPGGGGGGRGFGQDASRGNTSASAARLVAVADDRSNSLIVAAPSDAIPEVDRLIKEIDIEVDDVTEIRVFPLTNANPTEVAEILSELFPDPNNTTGNQRTGGNGAGFGNRFGGFGGGGFGGQGGFGGNRGGGNRGQQNTSERAKKMGSVVAVPDLRTSMLIVTASREMMPQIDAMIKKLDASRAKKQQVYVFNLENADVTQVEQVVRDMFDRSNSGRNNNNTSALQNRINQGAQQQGLQQTTGFGQGAGGGNLGSQFGR
jgi:general secretion pathway protein D